MKIWKHQPSIVQLQLLTWVAVLLLIFFSLLPMDGFAKSAIYTLVNTTAYAIIIYSNIRLFYPLLYQKRRFIGYSLLVILVLLLTGILRGYAAIKLYQHFGLIPVAPVSFLKLLGYVPGGLLIYVLSLVFRMAIAYFSLKQQTEEILLQKSQAELNLLKSQVQPHFLFNALNSIYYRVYKVDPAAAGLIEGLSDIMRYFVDESPKDHVPIASEVAFIENYMALERIRIRHGVTINFEKVYTPELRIPPMLLMTFIENVFKHGIDKSRKQNQVNISLMQQDGYLLFSTSNQIVNSITPNPAGGFGLANLTQRLKLLYGTKFELKTTREGELYNAYLKIPL